MRIMAMVLASLLLAAPAWADESAKNAQNQVKELARELLLKGHERRKANDHDGAYAHYKAAWRIFEHEQTAQWLGKSELRAGHYLAAAEHLDKYLREAPKDTSPEELATARKELAEAKKHVGTLRVTVAEAGAEVFLNEATKGLGPMDRDFFVEPRAYRVEVKVGARTIGVAEGEVLEGERGVVRLEKPLTTPTSAVNKPESRVPVVILGGAAAVIGTGIGVGYVLDATELTKQVRRVSSSHEICNQDLTECRDTGATVDDLNARKRNSIIGAAAAFGAGTAVLLGTLTYALWSRSKEPERKFGVSVTLHPRTAGVSLYGTF